MIDPNLKQTLRATLVPLVTNLVERLISAIPENKQPETSTITKKVTKAKKRKNDNKSDRTESNKMISDRKVVKSKNRGKAPLAAYKVEKIREGYDNNWTIRKIAEYAEVSKSSVVRYRPDSKTGQR